MLHAIFNFVEGKNNNYHFHTKSHEWNSLLLLCLECLKYIVAEYQPQYKNKICMLHIDTNSTVFEKCLINF